MTNNPTKYEQIPSYGFRGVVFTKCHRRTKDHYYDPPSRSGGDNKYHFGSPLICHGFGGEVQI